MSWNVEHFLKKPQDNQTQQRIDRISAQIRNEDPDVFAIYEVEGKDVFDSMVSTFPGYSFHITEGPQVQEILVGVRGDITAFFTQKVAFKAGVSVLRPGALLTIRKDNVNYPILFLHLKSKDDPRSFGLRDDMISKAIKFKKTLTLDKTYPHTWSNGTGSSIPDSALDHCYAAEQMIFFQFNNKNNQPGTSPDLIGPVLREEVIAASQIEVFTVRLHIHMAASLQFVAGPCHLPILSLD